MSGLRIIPDRSPSVFTHTILVRQLLVAIAAICIVWFLGGSNQPARAETKSFVIDLPIYGPIRYRDLIGQAERLAGNAINQQFSQNSELSAVQVAVTGDHHGEIIPILTATVSRAQWQDNPQVSTWSRFYSSSYALLQRDGQEERVAIAPIRSTATNNWDRAFLIDEAFDSGRLTGQAAQEYLSDLD